jgi:hypothetical protein
LIIIDFVAFGERIVCILYLIHIFFMFLKSGWAIVHLQIFHEIHFQVPLFYLQYETEMEASVTRQALHNTKWPLSNPKNLSVDFSSETEVRP